MAGESVADRLAEILQRIDTVAKSSHRDPKSIELVAVTKTKPLDMIDRAAQSAEEMLGKNQKRVSFGENYVQEAVVKIESRPHYSWHFIGPLQSNKVKDVVGRFALIHSVDRIKIANEISKEAQKKGLTQDVLLQIHLGDEETKHGFTAQEIRDSFNDLMALSGINLLGLMTLPPLSDDESVSRGYFRELKVLLDELKSQFKDSVATDRFRILSMGTTHDFEAAIREGATHVRVGTAIFGEREKRKV